MYEDDFRITAQVNNSGVIQKEYIYGADVNVPDYMYSGTTKYFFVKDHLGSPRLIVKADDGTIAQRLDYNDLGEATADTNSGFQPFGFAGGIYDAQTKLVKFGARDYDPRSAGRWTSKDPIRFDGGDTNLFGYVAQDPVNWVDYNGENKSRPGQLINNDGLRGGGGSGKGGGGGKDNGRSLPTKGPSSGELSLPNGNSRCYDKHGNPKKDIDRSHDHGAGKPHAHDWLPAGKGRFVRGPGRPMGEGE